MEEYGIEFFDATTMKEQGNYIMKNSKQTSPIKRNKSLVANTSATPKKIEEERHEDTHILETSGARMPDPSVHSGVTETEVRYAFKTDKVKESPSKSK